MNIASTPDEGATPLLSSSEDQQINEVPNTTGEKSLATNNEDNAEPSREARHSQPYSIDGGISALSLAMIIFYNVTGKLYLFMGFKLLRMFSSHRFVTIVYT